MWFVANSSRFAAQATLAADKHGADHWVVAVKGTFFFAPDGSVDIADEQLPVAMVPVHSGDPIHSSLIYESDLDYAAPGTDVVVHGSAHAPKDYQVRELNVALAVGGRNKVLRVTGERVWERWAGGLRPTEPLPFSRMPVTYERAFGGFAKDGSVWEPRNPAGTGISRSDIELVGRQAPNIELARAPIRAWPSRSTPAGFGPIARHWQPRAALSGTYDADWEENRAPLLPVDFDERFFFAAPPDQQFDPPLMGNETIRLTHLTPEGTEEFRLPRAALGITSMIRGKPVYRRPVLRTIIIQPDERRVVLVWHDALPCHGRKYDIDRTEIIEKAFI